MVQKKRTLSGPQQYGCPQQSLSMRIQRDKPSITLRVILPYSMVTREVEDKSSKVGFSGKKPRLKRKGHAQSRQLGYTRAIHRFPTSFILVRSEEEEEACTNFKLLEKGPFKQQQFSWPSLSLCCHCCGIYYIIVPFFSRYSLLFLQCFGKKKEREKYINYCSSWWGFLCDSNPQFFSNCSGIVFFTIFFFLFFTMDWQPQDEPLRQLAHCLKNSLNSYDHVARKQAEQV